jgi:phenylpropionate dioxygenase-like ring-hydroxylating dioxygenase large terminal subunit
MNGLATKPREETTDYARGRQYGRPKPVYDRELAEVGPGTPMGELMRRYWQPFALSSEINHDLPLSVRVLGEDLVAFRDGDGAAGLMYPRCMHRGASLLLGKIEAEGLRCPYHGWLFDTQGHLIDTPCEIDPTSKRLHNVVRQPWYPVHEKFGIAFAYMGPAEKEPGFPTFPLLDEIGDDEIIIPTGGTTPISEGPMALPDGQMDFNWLQNFENFMDPLHLTALHSTINGMQFNEYIFMNPNPCKFKTFDKGSVSWIGHWENKEAGVVTQAIFQTVVPNIHIEGPVFEAGKPVINWVVPRDDTSYRTFAARILKKGAMPSMPNVRFVDAKQWGPGHAESYTTWSLEDKQRWQTDYLVQQSLGPIQLHSEERLTTADAGIAMMRRVLRQQVKLVMDGGDPVGAKPQESDVVEIYASTARIDPSTGTILDGYMLKSLKDY